ncbi:alpha/beta fold hydrolase [Nocardia suismassiliense]|uniref:Alpha/beta fold hydrolase n=1 Tax=Nocardia suismassiliense TaxID=2077092 RepID=A0ABW6R5T2_9NOCA
MKPTRTLWLTFATIAATAALVTSSAVSASADPPAEQPRHSFAEYQGIPISIYEYGPSADEAPTLVTTGGWPGDSTIFETAARKLATKYHVVRYDQRGEGLSGHNTTDELNSLENLADEFGAVIDKTAPGKHVHVFTEGWGSFLTSEYQFRHPGRIASLSAIGAPSLDLAHYALVESGRDPAEFVKNMPNIVWYGALSTPALPELMAASGFDEAFFGAGVASAGDPPVTMSKEDMVASVSRYRASLPTRLGYAPAYSFLEVPIMQVFQSPDDSPAMITGLAGHTNNLWLTEIEGSHTNFAAKSWPLVSAELDKAIAATEHR